MPHRHSLIREAARIVMAIGVGGFWIWLLYKRQLTIVEDRDHRAGIQTLFSGRK